MDIRGFINACNANLKAGKRDRAKRAFDLAWAEYASGNGSEKDKIDLFHLRNNFYPTAGAAVIITENACSMEGAILALAGL